MSAYGLHSGPQGLTGATPAAEAAYEQSHFFSEQLTAFEVWLQFGTEAKPPPMQLPVVLQVREFAVNTRRFGCVGTFALIMMCWP